MADLVLLAGITLYAITASSWLIGAAFFIAAAYPQLGNAVLVFGGEWSGRRKALFGASCLVVGCASFVGGQLCASFEW